MTTESERYDAIVIGSGIGGLTCASLLAQLRGLRVLVLERHWRLGGFTHSFSRPNAGPWPVGLHYVGQMGDGDPVRAVMDLVTGHRLGWSPMPDPFERFHFPTFTAEQSSDPGVHLASLTERWPREADAVVRYFSAVDEAYEYFASRILPRRSASERPRTSGSQRSFGLAHLTTREALDAAGVQSPELRAVLTAQWGNYGLPPGRSSFVAHAIVTRHFRNGGWFPSDGSAGLADGARAEIEAAGGACRTAHEVERVLVERDRAIGVRVRRRHAWKGEHRDYLAPLVISDAGASTTFRALLPPDSPGAAEALRALSPLDEGSSAVQLFVALRDSPASLGARGENHWMFAGCDHDVLFERRNGLADGIVATAYLSFPSLKAEATPHHHTAELVAPLDYAPLAPWKDGVWRRRGREYETVKERISSALLAFADRHLPGLLPLTESTELGTPLTVERFTGHRGGAIYGLAPVPQRFAMQCLDVATPIRGLLLTGSDVAAAGIVGALMGGVATAGYVLGPGGMARVLAAARGRAAFATRHVAVVAN